MMTAMRNLWSRRFVAARSFGLVILGIGSGVVGVFSSACRSSQTAEATPEKAEAALESEHETKLEEAKPEEAKPEEAKPASEGVASDGLSVRVDPRVELFSMLFRAAGAPSYVAPAHDTKYERAVAKKIEEIADHPAVAASRRLSQDHGIGYNAPVGLAVHLEWPSLEPRRPLDPFPPHLDDRWQRVDLPAYLQQVRELVRDRDLERFFADHAAYFLGVETSVATFAHAHPFVPWFHGFFGDRDTEHILVQGLLTGVNNYGASIELPSGRIEAYQIVVVWDADDEGVPRPTEELLAYIVHESAHAHVNPRNRKAEATLQPGAEALFAQVARRMEAQAYGYWQVMVDESLVRAVTRLYLAEAGATTALERARAQDDSQGFAWVEDLVGLLAARRKAEGAAFSYDAALDDAAAVFARWASDESKMRRLLRFSGPINAAFQRSTTVVRPRAIRELAAYADEIAQKLGAEVADASKLKALSSERSWILYGSPSSNEVLREWLASRGWTVAKDRIALGEKHWDGAGLVLIAATPHPEDDTQAVVVYASHDAADVVGINGVFHGPTDWLIARKTPQGLQPLESGNFPKDDEGRFTAFTP
jgi:hypothetical protein